MWEGTPYGPPPFQNPPPGDGSAGFWGAEWHPSRTPPLRASREAPASKPPGEQSAWRRAPLPLEGPTGRRQSSWELPFVRREPSLHLLTVSSVTVPKL